MVTMNLIRRLLSPLPTQRKLLDYYGNKMNSLFCTMLEFYVCAYCKIHRESPSCLVKHILRGFFAKHKLYHERKQNTVEEERGSYKRLEWLAVVILSRFERLPGRDGRRVLKMGYSMEHRYGRRRHSRPGIVHKTLSEKLSLIHISEPTRPHD